MGRKLLLLQKYCFVWAERDAPRLLPLWPVYGFFFSSGETVLRLRLCRLFPHEGYQIKAHLFYCGSKLSYMHYFMPHCHRQCVTTVGRNGEPVALVTLADEFVSYWLCHGSDKTHFSNQIVSIIHEKRFRNQLSSNKLTLRTLAVVALSLYLLSNVLTM